MKNLRMAAGAALMTMCFALPANAAIFDFFWSGDPALDPNLISSDDHNAMAVGTVDIPVPNGASFTNADIFLSQNMIDIDIKTETIGEVNAAFSQDLFGTVSDDGTSASLTQFILRPVGVDFFLGSNGRIIIVDTTRFLTLEGAIFFQYTDQAAALASIKLTAAPGIDPVPPAVDPVSPAVDPVSPAVVPVPAALPLLGTGLAVFGLMGWRRKKAARKAA